MKNIKSLEAGIILSKLKKVRKQLEAINELR